MISALRHRDYRLLWVGQAVSYLGDQFHLVALPWLVLQLTHSPLQLGLVMAVTGVPRAAFMLLGGAWADRFSPRRIMLVSDSARFVLTGFIALATLTGFVRMWQLYVLAAVFGMVSGVFLPAANASVPRLLDDADLESGNALMRMAESGASFLGPAAAGLLIAAFGQRMVAGHSVTSLSGIGIAQAIDAASFGVSALCLLFVHGLPALPARPHTHPFHDIAEGLRYAWGHTLLRTLLLLVAIANMLVSGPLLVGLPVLADRHLGGAAAYGLLMSLYAGGNLAGMVGASTLKRPSDRVLRTVAVGVFASFGAVFCTLGYVRATWQAVPLLVLTGLGNGYVAVTFISQLQRMTPKAMLGRMMALMLLCLIGLMPLSQAIAGAIVNADLTQMFLAAGAGLVALGVFAVSRPELRHMSFDVGPADQ